MNEGLQLPYDERNEQDFLAMTKRIQAALDTMRTDRRVKRTETNLAKLADCARGTLHNRKWPISCLKQLKEEARQAREQVQSPAPRVTETARVDKYREQLALSRDELLAWKYKHDDLRARLQTLEAQAADWKRRALEAEAQLRSARTVVSASKTNVTVLPLAPTSKNESEQ